MLGKCILPRGWKWVNLGDICKIDSMQILPNSNYAKNYLILD